MSKGLGLSFSHHAGGSICKLDIHFYDAGIVWVGLTAYLDGIREVDIIRFFGLYLSKILFMVGEKSTASALALNVFDYLHAMAGNVREDGTIPRLSVLEDLQMTSEEGPNPRKRFRSQFFGTDAVNREIDISMPLGEEEEFGALSVMCFLQYLIINLSEKGMHILVSYMKHVIDYYFEIGGYHKLRSGFEADQYALNMLLFASSPEGIM